MNHRTSWIPLICAMVLGALAFVRVSADRDPANKGMADPIAVVNAFDLSDDGAEGTVPSTLVLASMARPGWADEHRSSSPRALAPPGCARAAARAGEQASTPRIRPTGRRVATLLLDGLRRSRTLQEQVEALEARDVVVYVGLRPDLHDRIGSVQWLTKAGAVRYLRARVSARPGDALIAAIGHELEHVREVANEPSIVDERSLAAWYARVGLRVFADGKEAWETQRAYDAGERIHRELASFRRGEAPAIRPRQPIDWWVIYQCQRRDWQ